jgi:polar amino acid transport system permease protein
METLGVVAAMYLVMTSLLMVLQLVIEKKMGRKMGTTKQLREAVGSMA